MPDMTNITDTLPDGRTVTSLVSDHDHGGLDASRRFGETHDTWHRDSSSSPPGGTVPHISSIWPLPFPGGTSGIQTMEIRGSGFTAESIAKIATREYPTTFISETELSAEIDLALLGTSAKVLIVFNDTTPSNPFLFNPTDVPAPFLQQLSPNECTVEDGSVLVRIFGTGFSEITKVRQADPFTSIIPTFISDTELQATLPSPAATAARTYEYSLYHNWPNNDGASSNQQVFTVTDPNAAPVITSLGPDSLPANYGVASIIVGGTGFDLTADPDYATIQFDGVDAATLIWSPTSVQAQYTPTAVGAVNVTVRNPDGVVSAAAVLTITTPPAPVINSIQAPGALVGVESSVTLNGVGFEAGSQVLFDAAQTPVVTTYVSNSRLTALVTPVDTSPTLWVRNTDAQTSPERGFSAAVPPALTSVSPNTVAVGAAPVMSIFGDIQNGMKFFADATEMAAVMGYPPDRWDVAFPAQAAAGTVQITARTVGGYVTNAIPVTITAVQEDPAAFTIDYIKEWVDDHPDLADETLASEEARGDDARTTLLSWLQGFIAHRDED
jgi:hypothetical protein